MTPPTPVANRLKLILKKALPFLPGVVIAAVTLLLYIPDERYYFFSPDQGYQLAVADQILAGVHPWVDVEGGGYGPLVFYGTALGQLLFNRTIAGEVFITFFGYFIGYMLLYGLLLKVTRNLIATCILTVVALFLFPEAYKYYIVLGPITFALGLYVYLHSPHKHRLWVLAFCTLINGFFRFDFGAYSVLPCVLAIAFTNRSPRAWLVEFSKFAGMVLACSSPWLIFLLSKGSVITAIQHTYGSVANQGRGLLLPSPSWDIHASFFSQNNGFAFVFYAYPVLCLACALTLFIRRKTIAVSEFRWMACATLFALCVYNHALHRTQLSYIAQVSPMFILLMGYLIGLVLHEQRRAELPRGVTIAVATLVASTFIMQFPIHHYYFRGSIKGNYERVRYNWRNYTQSRKDFVAMMGEQLPKDGLRYWMVDAVNYARETTDPDTTILIYPYYPHLYYWAERRHGMGMPHIFPVHDPDGKQQQKMIERLENEQIPLIIDNPDFAYDNIPERNAHVYAARYMQRIAETYKVKRKLGPAVVYEKE